MDIIVLGVYNHSDKGKLDDVVSSIDNLEIVWDYSKFNIEGSIGINLLEKNYKLFQIGILVEKEREGIFSSYPLIYEVSETFMDNTSAPKLFHFIDKLKGINISKMIIAFAYEWDEKSLVKVEKCNVNLLKKRLNSYYVWCESYLNLVSNTEMRGDEHPLIIEIESNG